jgi:transposase
MCLKASPPPPLPPETARIGQLLFPPEHVYRRIGDLYTGRVADEQFAAMYPRRGQPALSPAHLSIVIILQAMEYLSDRQAAAMVRTRLDWKYALHLGLEDPGFDASVLSEFRTRLVDHAAQRQLFDALLEQFREQGLLGGRALQRSDSMTILSAVRALNRLELVMETMRLALEAIAERDAAWLRATTPSAWLARYGEWTQAERLVKEKGAKGEGEARRMLEAVGRDGFALLEALEGERRPRWAEEPEAVARMRQVWAQQYRRVGGEAVELSTPASRERDGVAGEPIATPHDPQVRFSGAKGRKAEGYKLQLTETASEAHPAMITDVDVVGLTERDASAVGPIQQRLAERELAPEEQLVDRGYTSGAAIEQSRGRGVELVGPVQSEADGGGRFRASAFALDVSAREAVCPGGQVARRWRERALRDRPGQRVLYVSWGAAQCGACPLRAQCVSPSASSKTLKLSAHYEELRLRREQQRTRAFGAKYRRRAGVEATFSNLVRRYGGRRAKYRGRAKVLLQYTTLACAVNLRRSAAWAAKARVKRARPSRLRRLMGEEQAQVQGWGRNAKP